MRERLRDKRGFVLAEQLVSIIFLGLLCVAITAGLGAAVTSFGSVSQEAQAQQLLTRTVQEVGDELAFSLSVDAGDGSFVSSTTRTIVQIGNAADDTGIVLVGDGIAQGVPSAVGASVETVLLVPAANGLTPRIEDLLYVPADNIWQFTVDIVRSENNTVVVATTDMTVARVGG